LTLSGEHLVLIPSQIGKPNESIGSWDMCIPQTLPPTSTTNKKLIRYRERAVAWYDFYSRIVVYFYTPGIFDELDGRINALFTSRMFLCCMNDPA
jgi:hypothetical protein